MVKDNNLSLVNAVINKVFVYSQKTRVVQNLDNVSDNVQLICGNLEPVVECMSQLRSYLFTWNLHYVRKWLEQFLKQKKPWFGKIIISLHSLGLFTSLNSGLCLLVSVNEPLI